MSRTQSLTNSGEATGGAMNIAFRSCDRGALGARVNVPTLDGPVDMAIPAGAQGGQRLRLRGQGLNRRGGGRGDEYVRLKIVNPPRLTETERDLFQKLAAQSGFNARELMRESKK